MKEHKFTIQIHRANYASELPLNAQEIFSGRNSHIHVYHGEDWCQVSYCIYRLALEAFRVRMHAR